MKKLLFTTVLLLIIHLSFSQDFNSDFIAHIDSSGMYMQKGSFDLTMSMCSSVLSGVCAYWVYKKDIDEPGVSINGKPGSQSAIRYCFAGIFAISSISFYIAHLVHIDKAGDHLRKANKCLQKQNKKLSLQTNNNGIGLVYKF